MRGTLDETSKNRDTSRVRCVIGFALVSCATLANEGQGDRDLPSAGVGPFRKLSALEQRGTPPIVLDDPKLQFRDPAVLPATDDPKSTEIFLYATANDAMGNDVIVRTHANDARTFFARPKVVLAATKTWEEGNVRSPSVLRVNGEVWMYYSTKNGIGLARSNDGLSFSSSDTPALALAGAHGPSIVRLADGSSRMFYELGGQIWEAESPNGTAFTTRGVVLSPAPATAQTDAGEKATFDTMAVGDPFVTTRTTPAGRLQFRVLYTGLGVDGFSIGFAARYGTDGPLVRNAAPVFLSANGDSAPGLFELVDPAARTQNISFLYDTEATKGGYPGIAVAVAPVTSMLGAAKDFPDGP